MKKILFLTAFILMFSNIAFAENIGVVDLQAVVNNSAQVKQLKREYDTKLEELNKIVANARMEVAKETDLQKIAAIEEKYTKEFNTKKSALEREYNTKIGAIESKIREQIKKKAQEKKYDYVFAKSVVLYGGDDITSEVSASVKSQFYSGGGVQPPITAVQVCCAFDISL